MIGINTNSGSLIVQSNLSKATLGLQQAIERMTTGFKINHAKDNAAGYSIVTNMTTKIGAYEVAENNALMGLDMLNTASASLSLIDNALARLRALAVQASNGTYGENSLKAINSEANALVDEIMRGYNNAEYNGIKLFSGETSSSTIQADLINPIVQRDTSTMKALADVNENTVISGGTYSISTAAELKKLADMTNSGKVTGGEFVLGANIDLSAYSTGEGWTPIGDANNMISFDGTFDGNGYVISNLYINRPDGVEQSLFAFSKNGTFKNVALENVDINSDSATAGLLAITGDPTMSGNSKVTITNSYVAGDITGQQDTGGLVSSSSFGELYITNSYVAGNITGEQYVGGLVSAINEGNLTITNSYTTGNITGQDYVGGLVGGLVYNSNINIKNSYVLTNSDDLEGIFIGDILYTSSSSPVFEITGSYYSSYYDGKGRDFVGGYGSWTSSSGATGGAVSYSGGIPFSKTRTVSTAPLTAKTGRDMNNSLTLQVGTDSTEASQITLDLTFSIGSLEMLRNIGLDNGDYISITDEISASVSAKQTEFGAAQNRLESALEQISVQYENLVSSRSTIQDADIAEVSSEYIKMQILQNASATLLATANQTPEIALRLLGAGINT